MIDETYQYFDPEENSNKSWRIKWEAGTVTTYWGRVGNGMQSKTKSLSEHAARSLIAKKMREGYRLVEHSIENRIETFAPASSKVRKYLDLIAKAAKTSINDYLAIKTENLAAAQIEKGRDILRKVSKGNTNLIVEYYKTIPTKLPHKIYLDELIKTFDADEQENRLNQLEAAVASNVSVSQNAPFELSESTDADAESVSKLITLTAKHAEREFKIRDIISVKIAAEREAYEACTVGNVKRFFHGTAAGNIAHILRSGLLVPHYASHGRNFGNGIYFADVSTKSMGYCHSYDGLRMLLVADVRLGKTYTPGSSRDAEYLNTAPSGYDSLAAIAGQTSILAHSEYVVYNRAQQTIKFLVVL